MRTCPVLMTMGWDEMAEGLEIVGKGMSWNGDEIGWQYKGLG